MNPATKAKRVTMYLGVIFPQLESGTDPIALRDYVQAAEEIGYDHVVMYDHVLGADPTNRPGWRGIYTHHDSFHEPFVFLGYAAALTRRIGLATGVIILPQRQTALVAKQAAEIDVLSGGRLRLGVGVGWNEVEFQALNESFANRGARIVEQMAVLRELWTKPLVTFDGRWHHVDAAGINPLPIQRPIPIWMGGWDERVLRRIAEFADGWFPLRHPPEGWRAVIERIRAYARQAGRAPDAIGIEPRFSLKGTPDDWRKAKEEWESLGATHLALNTMGAGLSNLDAHIAAIRDWWEALQ
jgi:probable F420-dependent oxidoreductase